MLLLRKYNTVLAGISSGILHHDAYHFIRDTLKIDDVVSAVPVHAGSGV